MLKQVTDTYLIECTRAPPESSLADHDPRSNEKNNEWSTNLAQSLQLVPGDTVNLESAMIQSSIDDGMIELTGTDDTRGSLDVAYYLGNDWVFACPLPLKSSTVRVDYFYPAGTPGAQPDPDAAQYNLQRWSKYYGEQSFDLAAVPASSVTAPTHDVENVRIKCSRNLTPSYERMYLGEDYFAGPYANGESDTLNGTVFDPVYRMKTSTVEFDLPQGFYTPQDLTQTMTNRMHRVDGDCGKTSTAWVPALVKQGLDPLTRRYNVTDPVSKIVPTTSALEEFYRLEFGSTAYDALSVVERQRKVLYRNLLCAEPHRLAASGHLYSGITETKGFKSTAGAIEPHQDKQVYTGFRYAGVSDYDMPVGNFGLQVCINDFLPTRGYQAGSTTVYPHLVTQVEKGYKFTNFNTDFATTFNTADLGLLDLKDGDVIWTNLVANEVNYQNLKTAFDLLQYPGGADNTLVADIDLGRGDDSRCFSTRSTDLGAVPATNPEATIHSFNLLSPPISLDPTNATATIGVPGQPTYQYRNTPYHYVYPVTEVTPGTPAVVPTQITTTLRSNLVFKAPPLTTAAEPRLDREYYTNTGGDNREWGYRVRCKVNFDESYLPVKPTTARVSYKIEDTAPGATDREPLQHGTMGPLDSKGQAFDHSRIKELNLGCVVGFRQTPVLHSCGTATEIEPDGIKDVPFIGLVYHSQRVQDMPTPGFGEMMGISRSFSDLKCAKVISTQKENVGGDPGAPVYSTGGTDYVSTVNIGAANASFGFDTTLNKVTINELHTPLRTGQKAYNYNDATTYTPTSADGAENKIQKLHFNHAVVTDADDRAANPVIGAAQPWGLMSAQSGIGITGVGVNGNAVTHENYKNLWFKSLWFRLGFDFADLRPKYHNPQLIYNSAMYKAAHGGAENIQFVNQVSPLTTNGSVSTDQMVSLTANASNLPVFLAPGSVRNNTPLSIEQVPDFIVATGNPSLYSYSHLVVYSDIVQTTGKYIGARLNSVVPAVAYVTKSYVTGNYIYGQESPLVFTVDKPCQLSAVNIDIRLPDGRPANIDPNSSLIFRVIKSRTLVDVTQADMNKLSSKR